MTIPPVSDAPREGIQPMPLPLAGASGGDRPNRPNRPVVQEVGQ